MLESSGPKIAEVVVQEQHSWSLSNILRVMYTNVDGLLSSLLEFKDYLRTNKPDVVAVTETKQEAFVVWSLQIHST